MSELAGRNYFSDLSILRDPYAFFEAVRTNGPVHYEAANGYFLITGFEEGVQALLNHEDLSSIVAATGATELPEIDAGNDDISEQIQNSRRANPATELFVNYDGERHRSVRSLLDRLGSSRRQPA